MTQARIFSSEEMAMMTRKLPKTPSIVREEKRIPKKTPVSGEREATADIPLLAFSDMFKTGNRHKRIASEKNWIRFSESKKKGIQSANIHLNSTKKKVLRRRCKAFEYFKKYTSEGILS